MSHTIETAMEDGKPAPTFSPPNIVQAPRSNPRHTARPAPSSEEVLQRYLKRLEPEVAESFTSEQREAIKTMLGAREVARHVVEIRRSIPFGRKRFYTVLLIGRDQRSLRRLRRAGEVSRGFTLAIYAGLAALALAPAAGVALAFAL